jgi:type IV secretory pathway VirB10-like protein
VPLPAQVAPAAPEPVAPTLRPGESVLVAQEPVPLPEALQKSLQKSFDELVVSADSVIGLQSETNVSSERARVEDRVEARVTRDVRVGSRVAIPAGSRAIGVVSQVERGGKFKEHARLAIRFQTVVLADGTRLPISTDAVIREGAAPSNESAKKIGGAAVAGTILGAILGGAKGAAIGGMAGAGAGAGVVASGDRNAATLHAGEPITIRLLSPVTVTSER